MTIKTPEVSDYYKDVSNFLRTTKFELSLFVVKMVLLLSVHDLCTICDKECSVPPLMECFLVYLRQLSICLASLFVELNFLFTVNEFNVCLVV